MADKNIAFPFKEQQDILDALAGVIVYTGTFASGTSTTEDEGLEAAKVGSIVLANSHAYLVSAVDADTKVITAFQIDNAAGE